MSIKHWGAAALALGIGLFGARGAEAGFVFTVQEVAGGVELTGSGSINLAGLTMGGSSGFSAAGVVPGLGVVRGGESSFDMVEWTGITGPTSFGPGNFPFIADSRSGDPIFISGIDGLLLLHEDYVSGTQISNTAFFAGADFALLGVTPGTYVWTWGRDIQADSLTLHIVETAVVPEPASAGLMIVGLLCLATVHRRARRAAVLATSHPKGIVNSLQD